MEENTNFSNILERQGRRLIGRYCFMSDEEPFFLKTGVTKASFHLLGNIPELRDLLNSAVNGVAISMDDIFMILVGSLSGPVDLLTSREFNMFRTWVSVTCTRSRAGIASPSLSWSVAMGKVSPLVSNLV